MKDTTLPKGTVTAEWLEDVILTELTRFGNVGGGPIQSPAIDQLRHVLAHLHDDALEELKRPELYHLYRATDGHVWLCTNIPIGGLHYQMSPYSVTFFDDQLKERKGTFYPYRVWSGLVWGSESTIGTRHTRILFHRPEPLSLHGLLTLEMARYRAELMTSLTDKPMTDEPADKVLSAIHRGLYESYRQWFRDYPNDTKLRGECTPFQHDRWLDEYVINGAGGMRESTERRLAVDRLREKVVAHNQHLSQLLSTAAAQYS